METLLLAYTCITTCCTCVTMICYITIPYGPLKPEKIATVPTLGLRVVDTELK